MNPKLKFVLLHQPLLHWQDKEMQRYFCLMAELKIQGYGASYPVDRVYALDSHDWISTHFVAFHETTKGWEPLLAYKVTLLDEDLFYGLPFLGLTAFNDATPEHQECVKEIVENAIQSGRRMAYTGAWTIHPDLRKDPAMRELLRRVAIGTHALIMTTFGIDESICTGVTKFKTHEAQQALGYQLIQGKDGRELPGYPKKSLMGTEIVGLHLKEISREGKEMADSLKFMWRNRIEIGTFPTRRLDKKVAA